MATYRIETFGCQMNVHDSERMHELLRAAGYREVETPAGADVIVLNTCSVREKAEQKLRSLVGRLSRLARGRPDQLLVVAGCVAQQEGERLLRRMPSVDVVLGPDHLAELPDLLASAALGAPPVVRAGFDLDAPRFLSASPPEPGARRVTAHVTIMKGCDERCSFCIVPTTRGPERYRPSDDVVAEIARLVLGGVREVTLLGQTVNSYRDPLRALPTAPGADRNDPDESEFAALLRRIAREVPGLLRLRYTSPHPRHVTPSLLRAHAELDVLPAHVHLPVQSGSDRVLRRMIRRYTRAEYVERAAALRAARAGLTLSTDVIVGFPGETEADFEETLDLVREVGFLGLFGFKYSERPGTPSLRLGDDVPEEVKAERLARLFALSEALLHAHLSALVGTVQRVLVEGEGKRGPVPGGPPVWTGRTVRNEIVHIEGAEQLELAGDIVEVSIERANRHSLAGRLVGAARGGGAPRPGPRAPRGSRSLPLLAPGAG